MQRFICKVQIFRRLSVLGFLSKNAYDSTIRKQKKKLFFYFFFRKIEVNAEVILQAVLHVFHNYQKYHLFKKPVSFLELCNVVIFSFI